MDENQSIQRRDSFFIYVSFSRFSQKASVLQTLRHLYWRTIQKGDTDLYHGHTTRHKMITTVLEEKGDEQFLRVLSCPKLTSIIKSTFESTVSVLLSITSYHKICTTSVYRHHMVNFMQKIYTRRKQRKHIIQSKTNLFVLVFSFCSQSIVWASVKAI